MSFFFNIVPARQQHINAMGHTLKNLFDLDEEDEVHVVPHRSAKFGIHYFLVRCEE